MAQRAPRDTTLTAEDFLTHPSATERSELVRGEIRMNPPAGGVHGLVSGNVFRLLSTHVSMHRLGVCFADSTGFDLPNLPHTVRAPDASFVRTDRLPREGITARYLPLAPDLAVEVLSPSETASDLEEKLADYRTAGVSLVWVIDPSKRLVSVVAAAAPIRFLREDETLDGADVVPGFSCPVAGFFEGLTRFA